MNKRSLILSLSLVLVFTLVALGSGLANAQCQNKGFGPGGTCLIGGPGGQSLGSPSGGGPGGCGLSGGGMGNLDKIGQYVNLSDKQRQQMHDLRFSFMKKTLDLKEQLGQKRLERRALMEKDPVDWKKVDQLTDEIGQIKANMEKQTMRRQVEIKKILTPEQLKQLEDMNIQQGPGQPDVQGRGPGRHPGRGMGFGHGPGRGMGL